MATFTEVRAAELKELEKLRELRGVKLPADQGRVGLAFSGGGIRSATLNLGILQGLAKFGLLKRIDYLSTVSGGGFIGGWLIRWIYERGIIDVEKRLGDTTREAEPVTFLRDYSNYLTPRTGLLGADTWAAIATYLRNVLLNQIILAGFLGTVLYLPWILGSFFDYGPVMEPKPLLIGALAAILVIAAVAGGVVNTSTCAGAAAKNEYPWTAQRSVLVRVLLPLFAGAFCLNYTIWRQPEAWTMAVSVVAGTAVYFLGHFAGWLASNLKFGWGAKGLPTLWNVFWALPSGALAGVEVHALSLLLGHWAGEPVRGKWQAASWGPPLFVVAFLLAGTLHIGLAKFELRNEIHEWWARLGGWLMLWSLFWAALFGLAIFVPLLVFKVSAYASGPALWAKRAVVWGWILHSGLGARLGWSKNTSGSSSSQSVKEFVAKAAPFVFVAGLLIVLATAAHALALWVHRLPRDDADVWWAIAAGVPSYLFLILALSLAVVTAFLSWRVDINRFSMNLLYRNRIVRCYLGASNEARNAQKFTGFDPADDLRLACFSKEDACDPDQALHADRYSGPYPVLNATLNVTHGQRLAWQERKAEAFILSPLYCGFEYPEMKENIDRESAEEKGAEEGGYHLTDGWAMSEHGISLGTAISTSGAAVSPNMGFHSYPPLAFLMTVFNVRLGEWLANPRYGNRQAVAATRDQTAKAARMHPQTSPAVAVRSGPEGAPRSSLLYLLFELFGTTTDVSRFVYLSDGAHFENLAIYELVRRECEFIIASDAGEDAGYVFADLSNAIRKCRTDLGAEITLHLAPITAHPENGRASCHAVRGDILYRSGKSGQLLYFKSCLTGKEPNDVADYRRLHPEFPQQSTADQWFDESQFESYRELGFLAAKETFGLAKCDAPSIEEVFALVAKA